MGVSLRQHLAQVIVEAIVRAACWLLKAEELPRLQLPARPEPKPAPTREEVLGRLFLLDSFLAYALGTCPWAGHDVDTRWRQ